MVVPVASKRTREFKVPPVPRFEFWTARVPAPEIVPFMVTVPALEEVTVLPEPISKSFPEFTCRVPETIKSLVVVVAKPAIVKSLNVVPPPVIVLLTVFSIKTVLELLVNVPEFEKFPATVRRPLEGAVRVPEVTVKSVVEALASNVHEPELRNSTLPRSDVPVSVPPRVLEVPVK